MSVSAQVDLRDGNDFAFLRAPGSLKVTVPQTYAFAPTGFDRTADLRLFAANATNDPDRPRGNFVRTTVSGSFGSIVTDTMNPFFGSSDGLDWDTAQIDVDLPAGADSVTVEVVSAPEDAASLIWITGGLAVPSGPGMLGDCVWEDQNGNGLQDFPEEPGIPDVKLNLTRDCGGSGSVQLRLDPGRDLQ